MYDTISRQAAIDALMPIYKSASLRNRNVFSTARKCMVTIEELPSARPDNQINLCDSCDYSYPDCPSKNGDVIFGNNIGNDNICACNKYKPSEQPLTAYVISDEDGNIKCSNCGSPECWGNYCMDCGAKMRGKNNG